MPCKRHWRTEKGPGRRSLPGPLQCKHACKYDLAHLSDVSDVGRGDLVLELDAHAGIAGGSDGQIAGLDVAELLSGLDRLDDRAVDGALGNLAWCGITPQYMIICWTAHSWRENAQIGMLGRKCEIKRAVRPVVVGTVMHLAPTVVAMFTADIPTTLLTTRVP